MLAPIALFAAMTLNSAALKAEQIGDSNILHTAPCTKQAGERQVTLDINPKPVRHMQELTFRVNAEPAKELPATLVIDLSMPGMMMGKNQVTLKRQADGAWVGKGLIVKCMSGRKLWQATILSPELGNPAFTFNVRD